MTDYNNVYSDLLTKDIKHWIAAAETAANDKNLDIFEIVNTFITDYFAKIVVELNSEKLSEFNSLIIHFCIDFYWDKENPKFVEAAEFVNVWKGFANIAERLKSIHKFSDIIAKIKNSGHNIKIIKTLANTKLMKSSELAKSLNIEQNLLCNQTVELEKHGIIGREKSGKNSYYYLTAKGRKIFDEQFAGDKINFIEYVRNNLRNFLAAASETDKKGLIEALKSQDFFDINAIGADVNAPGAKVSNSNNPKDTALFWR